MVRTSFLSAFEDRRRETIREAEKKTHEQTLAVSHQTSRCLGLVRPFFPCSLCKKCDVYVGKKCVYVKFLGLTGTDSKKKKMYLKSDQG